MESTITSRIVRLSACALVRTRFVGRAALEQRAARNDLALVELEIRLGLATDADLVRAERAEADQYIAAWSARSARYAGMTPAARELRAAIDYARGGAQADTILLRIVARRQCAAIDRVRAERAERRAHGIDPLAARVPGAATYAAALLASTLRALVRAAEIRKTTHGATCAVQTVAAGQEGARSETAQAWTARNETRGYHYPNAESHHAWRVSADLRSACVRALNEAAPVGIVYLSATTRVRNGRGTSLVTERATARGAWR